jgi:hypothetical protein
VRPRPRTLLLIVLAVVALNLVIAGLNALVPSTQGPAGSSYATSSDGVGAMAELLRREGHTVTQQRGSLAGAALSADSTLVLLKPDALIPSEGARLRAFLAGGGRVVAGGGDPAGWLRALGVTPAWTDSGPRLAQPLTEDRDLGSAHQVLTEGSGSWDPDHLDGFTALLGESSAPVLIGRDIGAGRLLLLADLGPLSNRLLASADDAELALALAGPASRPVVFAEGVHGYGLGRGLDALPSGWLAALVLLALAAFAFAFSRARRLGPPEDSQRALAPPRRAFIDAMAVTLERTRDPAPSTRRLRAATLERLRRSSALPHEADSESLLRAAEGLGVPAPSGAALVGEGVSGTDLLECARALAVLERRRGES